MLAPLSAQAATSDPAPLQGSGISTTTAPTAGGDPDTTMMFTVTSGALTMSAPASANLGSGAPGTTISSPLGTIEVADDRALLSASWTATASSTIWVTGTGTGSETIPANAATYTPGPIQTTGVITATGQAITLTTSAQTVVTGSAGVGDSTASWDPTIAVEVPPSAVSGTYTATLTQSVS
ncbi:MAG TPA: hypothetical protein VFX25_31600 [Streptosporangiaceae bacterium]|nr:hypothetical protein [Streptosporangiaceae bacterium]